MKFKSSIDINSLNFDEKGLIPAVIQDNVSGKVLMMAYMNREALNKTLETGQLWYWSRSRKALWCETSDHSQQVESAYHDCDSDSLLFKIKQSGATCQTGEYSCFNKSLIEGQTVSYINKVAILQEVYEVIIQRKHTNPENSYVAKKMQEGIDRILKKVGEEAGEVIIAAKNGKPEELSWEMADLIFHLWMVLGFYDLSPDIIYDKLMERRK